jgi:hypothetical protein
VCARACMCMCAHFHSYFNIWNSSFRKHDTNIMSVEDIPIIYFLIPYSQ